MKTRLLLIILGSVFSLQLNAATHFVTTSGAGSMDGTSWANAFPGTSLQVAIDASGVGDEVWVAVGTYYTTTTTDRSISFSMKTGVAIYGGFVGTETQLSERDLTNGSNSILSGELGGIGTADNSYKVVYNQDLDSTAILDGFVIERAHDDRSPTNSGNGLGGGMYNHGYNPGGFCHPTIRNCFFRDNVASWGAGAFNNGYNGGNTQPTYINCIFRGNYALNEAGGMDSYGYGGTASPTVINSIFYNNVSATNVGAMYAWGGGGGNCHPLLINCTFVYNSASNGYGGAFIADNLDQSGGTSSGSCTVTLQNCIVRSNSATGEGPQFYVRGTGAQVIATHSNIELANQTFPNVISGTGAGNIDLDPLFLSTLAVAGADGIWMTADDGLTLQSGSPCIDAGDNAGVFQTDLLSNNRIFNGTVDMGAYEYVSTSGIDDNSLETNVEIFPNPTSKIATIALEGSEESLVHVLLTDLNGRELRKLESTQASGGKIVYEVDLSEYQIGVYFIVFETAEGSFTRRVLRVH